MVLMQWCFVILVFSVNCWAKNKDSNSQHLHHHYQYYSKYKQNNNTANETEYKAAPGEILAKDSILYSQQPESRQLRRQLWPIMEETMQKLATSVATGAHLLKHIMQPSKADLMKYQNMQKARKIKNVYLSARKPFAIPLVATKNTYKRHTAPKKQKKPVIPKPVIIDSGEMTTLSDDYKLTYGKTPSYTVKTAAKNIKPYSELGVTGYKHFEKTVLRELEEKEEKKVEATMVTLNSGEEQRSNAEIDLIKGIPNGGWTPVVKLLTTTTEKPKAVSKLHTNVNHFDATIRPIHEDGQESKRVEFESTVERPSTASSSLPSRHSKYASRIPKGFASTAVTTTTQKSVLASAITKDQPNYPDYYLRKNKHLMQDSKKQSTTKAIIESSAPSIYSQLMDMETSSSMNTPRIPRVSQRQKAATTNTTITSSDSTKTKSGRGSIRFGKQD